MESVILIHNLEYEVAVFRNSQLHSSAGGTPVLITSRFYIECK